MIDSQTHIDSLAYSQGAPEARATIRSQAEDFQVEEQSGFEPDHEGDHAWLVIKKRHTNTDWLARQLAQHANVKLLDVGYAGIKDRHAVSTQSFTVNIAGKQEPDWSELNCDEITILKVTRHRRTLKRGSRIGNRVQLILRHFEGCKETTEARLQTISEHGVPNYFGSQRFGFNNLQHAHALLVDKVQVKERHKRSLYISSARSFLFNIVLSERVKQGFWNRCMVGDRLIDPETEQLLITGASNNNLNGYLDAMKTHPTAPLWGRGLLQTTGQALQFEQETLSKQSDWLTGLEYAGLQQQRRATRLEAKNLQWCWLDHSTLQLQFNLTSGSYATTVLREVAHCSASTH